MQSLHRIFNSFTHSLLHSLLPHRIAGEFDTEFAEDLSIYFGEHDGGVDLTAC